MIKPDFHEKRLPTIVYPMFQKDGADRNLLVAIGKELDNVNVDGEKKFVKFPDTIDYRTEAQKQQDKASSTPFNTMFEGGSIFSFLNINFVTLNSLKTVDFKLYRVLTSLAYLYSFRDSLSAYITLSNNYEFETFNTYIYRLSTNSLTENFISNNSFYKSGNIVTQYDVKNFTMLDEQINGAFGKLDDTSGLTTNTLDFSDQTQISYIDSYNYYVQVIERQYQNGVFNYTTNLQSFKEMLPFAISLGSLAPVQLFFSIPQEAQINTFFFNIPRLHRTGENTGEFRNAQNIQMLLYRNNKLHQEYIVKNEKKDELIARAYLNLKVSKSLSVTDKGETVTLTINESLPDTANLRIYFAKDKGAGIEAREKAENLWLREGEVYFCNNYDVEKIGTYKNENGIVIVTLPKKIRIRQSFYKDITQTSPSYTGFKNFDGSQIDVKESLNLIDYGGQVYQYNKSVQTTVTPTTDNEKTYKVIDKDGNLITYFALNTNTTDNVQAFLGNITYDKQFIFLFNVEVDFSNLSLYAPDVYIFNHEQPINDIVLKYGMSTEIIRIPHIANLDNYQKIMLNPVYKPLDDIKPILESKRAGAVTVTHDRTLDGSNVHVLPNPTLIKNTKRVSVKAKFTAPVNVLGTPIFNLIEGSTPIQATYKSGSGTDTLTFEYIKSTGTLGTVTHEPNPIQLNGGNIVDAQGTVFYEGFIETSLPANTKIQSDVAVGIEDINKIPNSAITASSAYGGTEAYQGRLNGAQGWAARIATVGQWWQADVGSVKEISRVASQGRGWGNRADQWIQSYKVQYSVDGRTWTLHNGGQIYMANTDKDTIVTNELTPTIQARYIRILPQTWQGYPTGRFEIYESIYT